MSICTRFKLQRRRDIFPNQERNVSHQKNVANMWLNIPMLRFHVAEN